ncbi:MAG: IPT/TIG domain-containing protein, partial [Anaerolineae bacterium]|nr:IPT/TIG domain-containing protein [Anaerolineae bacterium]
MEMATQAKSLSMPLVTPQSSSGNIITQVLRLIFQPVTFFRAMPGGNQWVLAALLVLVVTGYTATTQVQSSASSASDTAAQSAGFDLSLFDESATQSDAASATQETQQTQQPQQTVTDTTDSSDTSSDTILMNALIAASGMLVIWVGQTALLSLVSMFRGFAPQVGKSLQIAVWASLPLALMLGLRYLPPSLLLADEATSVPQLTVTQTEPSQITAGQSATLSIIGTNFSSSTTVRLVGYGFLATTLVNSGALTVALPSGIPTGVYSIEVADSTSGSAVAPGTLTVVAAAVVTTATAVATATPTATAVAGQPRLVVNTFYASPASIFPGGTTTLTIEVLNVGSRTAEGVVLALGSSTFTPANGQASVMLPDLPAMTSYVVTLSVTAPSDAAEGSQSIPLVMTSRDFSGQMYTNDASVSVTVLEVVTGTSQLVLDSYVIEPSSAAPGDTVTLRALFKNTGSATAEQVLIQLDGTDGVLIAGADGNSFAVGDMPAGAGAPVVMRFIISSNASSGAQAQALTISYLQDGNAKQSSASVSLNVETVTTPTPLLLLQSYNTGQTEALEPGQHFSLALTVQNAGTVDVSNLLVTFGTVSNGSSSSSSSSSSSGSSTSGSGSNSTTITPSTDFAIYGSGGTILLGDLAAGGSASLMQEFIVSSSLTSGIQDLPITL